jgi:hypothetical protein
MFKVMSSLTDAFCGEEPEKLHTGPGASKVRENRKMMMDVLHRLVHLSMREGAARAMNTHSRSGIELPSGVHIRGS